MLNKVYPQVDSSLRNTLLDQLVVLLDFYLDGYVCQLKSVDRPSQQDRYNTLDLEYTQKRSQLLAQLRMYTNPILSIKRLQKRIQQTTLLSSTLRNWYLSYR